MTIIYLKGSLSLRDNCYTWRYLKDGLISTFLVTLFWLNGLSCNQEKQFIRIVDLNLKYATLLIRTYIKPFSQLFLNMPTSVKESPLNKVSYLSESKSKGNFI